jgi:hypothetical protein
MIKLLVALLLAAAPFDDSALAPAGYEAVCQLPNLRTFNVTDYGADGSDDLDDTPAIRAAIAAANSFGGGIIYLPAGTYLVCPQAGDPIPKIGSTTAPKPYGDIFHISTSNLTFIGDGPDKTVIKGRCFNLADPLTNWVVTGDSYVKIGRFTVFGIFSSANTGPISNIAFRSLAIDGGAGYTGNFTVGGIPSTGDGWDMRHAGIRISGPVSLDNILVLNCDLHDFRGEVVWAGGPFVQRIYVLKSKIRGSNASALSVSANVVVNASQLGGPLPADQVQNGCENYATSIGQQTTVENGSLIQAHSNGLVYIGGPSASFTVMDSTLTGNGKAILLSEQAYNVHIGNNQFSGNKNGLITSLLNLYPLMKNKGFGSLLIENNQFLNSGGILISQPGKIANITIAGNFVGAGSQLLSGDFTPPAGQTSQFTVSRNTFAVGSKDVASRYVGRVAIWQGNVRPTTEPQRMQTAFAKYDQLNPVQPVQSIAPVSDTIYLNAAKTVQVVAFYPPSIAQCPDGVSFTIVAVKANQWVLRADATNSLGVDFPVPVGGVKCVVTGGKVFVNK